MPDGKLPYLPEGFGLAVDPTVRQPRPDVIIGGSPTRVLRLRPAGATMLGKWAAGEPVSPSAGAQVLARRLLDAGIVHPRPGRAKRPELADTTVVIPVRDRSEGLAITLQALAGATKVVIVDDGSTTPVVTPDAAGRPDTTVVRLDGRDRPAGPAAARNAGWRAAQAEVLVFVDADCVPAPGWLDTLLPHFADPAVGAVAPRIVSVSAPGTPPSLAAYERRHSSLDLGPREGPVRPASWISYVPSAALAVRASALTEAGGFDESRLIGEDVDLVWRLHELGWRVRYEPVATVTHPSRKTVGAWLKQRYDYGGSAAPLAARHGRAAAPVAISRWSGAAWGLAVAGQPIAGAVMAAATAAALAGRGGDADTALALAKLAVTGNLRAGPALAAGVRRAWLPPAIAAAAAARRLGVAAPAIALAAVLVAPPVAEWVRDRPEGVGPLRWSALRLADDLAYQAGLWSGVVKARSAAALLPRW